MRYQGEEEKVIGDGDLIVQRGGTIQDRDSFSTKNSSNFAQISKCRLHSSVFSDSFKGRVGI
jgi:hypothetical protein